MNVLTRIGMGMIDVSMRIGTQEHPAEDAPLVPLVFRAQIQDKLEEKRRDLHGVEDGGRQ